MQLYSGQGGCGGTGEAAAARRAALHIQSFACSGPASKQSPHRALTCVAGAHSHAALNAHQVGLQRPRGVDARERWRRGRHGMQAQCV